MKRLIYSLVVVSVVILALLTIGQLTTAQNKGTANTESVNQEGPRQTIISQLRPSDNIWTKYGVNHLPGGNLSNTTAPDASLFTQFVQQGPKLVGTGAVAYALQGASVSISADGNTAVVGGSYDGSIPCGTTGAVWIWTRSGGVWTQQGPKLVGSGAVGCRAYQGQSVSISADGDTVIVGGGEAIIVR